MPFSLEPLPYPFDALAPAISARTVRIHYEQHQRGYVEGLERATAGTPAGKKTLEGIIQTESGSLYNQAAQAWNHAFYWRCMKPGGGGEPTGMLRDIFVDAFGSCENFKREFSEAANGEFGSGWAWLVRDRYGRMQVQKSTDAGNPLEHGYTPLLTLDVWEHAYYLDYQNERARYVERFLDDLIDWEFVGERLQVPSEAEIAGWQEAEEREEEARWGQHPAPGE